MIPSLTHLLYITRRYRSHHSKRLFPCALAVYYRYSCFMYPFLYKIFGD